MKLLVTGAFPCTDAYLAELESLGHEVIVMLDERGPLPEGSEATEGIVCNGLFLHHSLDSFPALRFIQLTSAGLDRAPVDECAARGIALHNAKGVYAVPIAEWVVSSILQFYKQARFFADNQSQKVWEKHRGLLELSGRTACIVGMGDIGVEVATRLKAFGVTVVGVNSSGKPSPHADRAVSPRELLSVLPEADFVIVAVPLTSETENLIDASAIEAMKDDAVLVNVARGEVLDEAALENGLDHGKFAGVALDVFRTEPLQVSSSLWERSNVIVSPHNSFVSPLNSERLRRLLVSNLERAPKPTSSAVKYTGELGL